MNKWKKFLCKIFYRPKLNFHGKNNVIIADNSVYYKRVKISIWGNNNKIILGKNLYLHNTDIKIGFPNCNANNCTIKIDDNTNINSMKIQMGESNSHINIGKNCMISHEIEINCTDHHSIFNIDNRLINQGKYVEIGDNVWLCKNVLIQKNSKIPSNSIVGQRAVIAGTFEETNCVIAGNPAKIVKRNIHWDKIRPNEILD